MHCVLHIGMPKTGTKSIQRGLAAGPGKEFLEAQNIGCPAIELENGNLFTNFSDLLYSVMIPNPNLIQRKMISGLEKVFESFQRQPWRSALISAESVGEPIRSAAELAKVRDFLSRWFDAFRAVIYLREPREYAGSRMAQSVSEGYPLSLAASGLNSKGFDYTAQIRTLKSIFQGNNDEVVVRSFDRQKLKEGDLIRDFLIEGLQLEEARLNDLPHSIEHENHSITAPLVKLLDAFYVETGQSITKWSERAQFRPWRLFDGVAWKGPNFRCEEILEPEELDALDACRTNWNQVIGEDFFPSYQPGVSSGPEDQHQDSLLLQISDAIQENIPESGNDRIWAESFHEFVRTSLQEES